ncbi:MAG: hypothetical protein RLZZ528_137 [Pseudomonadota bacterium]|jgi:cytochrome b561
MTGLWNGPDRFGLVTRLLHWTMALAILLALGLGTYIARMEVGLSNLWLFALHKSLGMSILALAVLRIGWHLVSVPPMPLGAARGWKAGAARAVHRMLYLLVVLVPVSGWVASSATGLDSIIFGRWVLPPVAPVSEGWESAGFALHGALTKLLAGLVVLHVAAALTRRDGTLRRMLRGTAGPGLSR